MSLGAAANPHHVVGTHTRNTSNGNGLPLGSLAEPLDFGRPATANSSHYGGTMPPMSSKAREAAGLDEFGYKGSKDFTSANTAPTRVQQPPPQDDFANRPVEPRPTVGGRRPGTGNSATGRFTVTNLDEKDHHRNESSPPATARNWLPAEEEKKRLYDQARAEVARVQGDAASPVCLSFSDDMFHTHVKIAYYPACLSTTRCAVVSCDTSSKRHMDDCRARED